MLYPGKTCVIGNGVVIDPEQLLKELGELRARGKDRACLRVSGAAHVVMPYHKLFDQLQEESRDSEHKIGTTGRGIGPCYVDKYTRIGIRVEDLLDEHVLREKLGVALAEKNRILAGVYGKEPLALDPIYERAKNFRLMWRTSRSRSPTRSKTARRCYAKARRARCSTSITERIPW